MPSDRFPPQGEKANARRHNAELAARKRARDRQKKEATT